MAGAPNQPLLVQDFFDTIEEAGLGDIAAEVGLVTRNGAAPTPAPHELLQGQSAPESAAELPVTPVRSSLNGHAAAAGPSAT